MDAGADILAYEADTPRRRALDAAPSRKPRLTAKAPALPGPPDALKGAVGRALALRREVDRFQQAWPADGGAADPFPGFSWAQLERQISSLARPAEASLAAGLIRSVRAGARHKPPEMVLREILCLASALMDEDRP